MRVSDSRKSGMIALQVATELVSEVSHEWKRNEYSSDGGMSQFCAILCYRNSDQVNLISKFEVWAISMCEMPTFGCHSKNMTHC